MPPLPRDYSRDVFINCPFDAEYQPFFHAIVFTVLDCEFTPRCAQEVYDSSEVRLTKIMRIIGECQYAIHDISRTELNRYHLPRFNMPLELGIFLGCKHFGNKHHQRKSCIVLDRSNFRYQKFISDIAGQDLSSHNGSTRQAVCRVRDWLNSISKNPKIPAGRIAWNRFQQFQNHFPAMCHEFNLDSKQVCFVDYQKIAGTWILRHPW